MAGGFRRDREVGLLPFRRVTGPIPFSSSVWRDALGEDVARNGGERVGARGCMRAEGPERAGLDFERAAKRLLPFAERVK